MDLSKLEISRIISVPDLFKNISKFSFRTIRTLKGELNV